MCTNGMLQQFLLGSIAKAPKVVGDLRFIAQHLRMLWKTRHIKEHQAFWQCLAFLQSICSTVCRHLAGIASNESDKNCDETPHGTNLYQLFKLIDQPWRIMCIG